MTNVGLLFNATIIEAFNIIVDLYNSEVVTCQLHTPNYNLAYIFF